MIVSQGGQSGRRPCRLANADDPGALFFRLVLSASGVETLRLLLVGVLPRLAARRTAVGNPLEAKADRIRCGDAAYSLTLRTHRAPPLPISANTRLVHEPPAALEGRHRIKRMRFFQEVRQQFPQMSDERSCILLIQRYLATNTNACSRRTCQRVKKRVFIHQWA